MEPSQRQWEEQDLRAAVLAGHEHAWRTLYERHFAPLFAYVYARTRDTHRTEEIVQDAWLTAVRRIRSFDPGRGPFGAWLRGIADRLLVNERRQWSRRVRLWREHGEGSPEPPRSCEAGANGVEEALDSLPSRYGDVLRAKYEERRSVAEIARAWGVSEKAVESLLSRARHAFRAVWTRLRSGDA
jgi:RNA polymerase sigma factor (sigma-70 family)